MCRAVPIPFLSIALALAGACGGGGGEATADPTIADSTSGADADAEDAETGDATSAPEGEGGEEESAGGGGDAADAPSFEGTITRADLDLMRALAAGQVELDRVVAPEESGVVVIDHYDDEDGDAVVRARHYCRNFLANHLDEIKTKLVEDVARGEELNDMGCNPLYDPPRIDCSIGGTETQPVSHYIFVESDEGVHLQAVYHIAEIGQSERYVARAHRYADRQAGNVRGGCAED